AADRIAGPAPNRRREMQTAAQRDDARFVKHLAHDHQVIRRLDNLGVWVLPHRSHRRPKETEKAAFPRSQILWSVRGMLCPCLTARVSAALALGCEGWNLAILRVDDEGRTAIGNDRTRFVEGVVNLAGCLRFELAQQIAKPTLPVFFVFGGFLIG